MSEKQDEFPDQRDFQEDEPHGDGAEVSQDTEKGPASDRSPVGKPEKRHHDQDRRNAQDRKQLSGVVGTSSALNQAIDFSPRIALYVLALISLSLGVINLFPFLPLDCGHIFWSLVEKVRGRRVPFAWMERASAIGFLLVIMLFVIGLTNDIGRLSS